MPYYPCYIADDDENIAEAISKILEKAFPKSRIYTFDHGVDLNNALMKEKENSIIICDFNLQGLNGLQILKKIRTESNIKDSFFILLVPQSDKENQIKSIQLGAEDFITKPLSYEQLILKLKIASKVLEKTEQTQVLKNELIKTLEELSHESDKIVNICKKFYEFRINSNKSDRNRIKKISEFIARNLSHDANEINEIINAADIYFLPQLFLPDKYQGIPVYSDGIIKVDLFEKIPSFIMETFSEIKAMNPLIKIIRHINENYDGSGFPDKLKGPEIPLGSRILRVILDFDYLSAKNNGKVSKSLETLWESMNKTYDFRIIAYLDQFFANENSKYINNVQAIESKVNTNEFKEDMILSRDIIVISGHKLVSSGTKLTDEIIEKITNAFSTESILGNIFIRNIIKE